MSRSARMFEIIQLLRSAPHPLTAADIAETLEVTKRTIYRDVASLQAMRVPIDGAAGIGYIMRPGFDLPPINFDIDEAEAITVGLSLLGRTGDKGLIRAARRAAGQPVLQVADPSQGTESHDRRDRHDLWEPPPDQGIQKVVGGPGAATPVRYPGPEA